MEFKNLKPVIGIPLRRERRKEKWINFMNEYHLQLLSDNGAVPLLIPLIKGIQNNINLYKAQLHGLMIVEGPDVDPYFYKTNPGSAFLIGQTEPLKDQLEFKLTRWAINNSIPILGICRGCQLLNAAYNGLLYIDVQKEMPSNVKHNEGDKNFDFRHHLHLVPNTPLHTWYGRDTLNVTSYHHQGIKVLAKRFKPMAHAEDGLIEAFYDPLSKFTVGLQFHPERMLSEYEGNYAVYRNFVKAAKEKAIEMKLKEKHEHTHEKKYIEMSLFYAAKQNDLENVKKVIEKEKVNVNSCDFDNRTALHIAANEGHIKIVKYLISMDANINILDKWGRDSLSIAINAKHDDVAKVLKAHGAKLKSENYINSLVVAAAEGNLMEVRRLVENGIDVNKGDYDQRTALHLACAEGKLNIVEYLVSSSVNINPIDRWGETPLQEAIRHNRQAIVNYLRKYGGQEYSANHRKLDSPTPSKSSNFTNFGTEFEDFQNTPKGKGVERIDSSVILAKSQSIIFKQQPMRVTVYIVNSKKGKVVSFPPNCTLSDFLLLLKEKFNSKKPIKAVYNKQGVEIDNLDVIEKDDFLWIDFQEDEQIVESVLLEDGIHHDIIQSQHHETSSSIQSKNPHHFLVGDLMKK